MKSCQEIWDVTSYREDEMYCSQSYEIEDIEQAYPNNQYHYRIREDNKFIDRINNARAKFLDRVDNARAKLNREEF